eukprot:CAMPEP_0114988440 /NCGR_PEP_ID=MMETSP0216-20121206/9599_1 /TAXON_ID=223996 /ORGANISM="Protocruzia adherens, Strain Boccale" /LENGTH=307 /DNA_ID=CAMNT_0002351219 /DNA_START=18 /DNA_END=938 /DNA_ORIENTATION=+
MANLGGYTIDQEILTENPQFDRTVRILSQSAINPSGLLKETQKSLDDAERRQNVATKRERIMANLGGYTIDQEVLTENPQFDRTVKILSQLVINPSGLLNETQKSLDDAERKYYSLKERQTQAKLILQTVRDLRLQQCHGKSSINETIKECENAIHQHEAISSLKVCQSYHTDELVAVIKDPDAEQSMNYGGTSKTTIASTNEHLSGQGLKTQVQYSVLPQVEREISNLHSNLLKFSGAETSMKESDRFNHPHILHHFVKQLKNEIAEHRRSLEIHQAESSQINDYNERKQKKLTEGVEKLIFVLKD